MFLLFPPLSLSFWDAVQFCSLKAMILAASSELVEGDPEKVKQATALLHETGEAPDFNFRTWRLKVKGKSVSNTLKLSYGELSEMEMVNRNVVLVCPGAFSDRADWEGVPLNIILDMAEVSNDYTTLKVVGLDGFTGMFSRKEVDEHLIFLALKVNGVTLPKEHGFPVRIVAEDILGGKWVKWIDYIEIY
jgi:sulfoxide reductase catalytic subunit YedY